MWCMPLTASSKESNARGAQASRPRAAHLTILWARCRCDRRCDAAALSAERAGCSARAGMISFWPPPR